MPEERGAVALLDERLNRLESRLIDLHTTILTSVRSELLENRVARAESHSNYIRNALTILALIVSLVLGFAAYLGIRSTKDIQDEEDKIGKAEQDVTTRANNIDAVYSRAEEVIASTDPKIQGMETRLNDLQGEITSAKNSTSQIQAVADTTSILAQQNRIDTNNLRMSSGMFSAGPTLEVPLLTSVSVGRQIPIQGKGFGSQPGRLWVAPQGAAFASLSNESEEVPSSSIQEWTDERIVFTFTKELAAALKEDSRKAQASAPSGIPSSITLSGAPVPFASGAIGTQTPPSAIFLTFTVVNASGQTSIPSGAVYWNLQE